MKILNEAPGSPTIIQLESDESVIIFSGDGSHEALMAGFDEDPDGEAKPSAVEMVIALTALADPSIRAMIEERISNA